TTLKGAGHGGGRASIGRSSNRQKSEHASHPASKNKSHAQTGTSPRKLSNPTSFPDPQEQLRPLGGSGRKGAAGRPLCRPNSSAEIRDLGKRNPPSRRYHGPRGSRTGHEWQTPHWRATRRNPPSHTQASRLGLSWGA